MNSANKSHHHETATTSSSAAGSTNTISNGQLKSLTSNYGSKDFGTQDDSETSPEISLGSVLMKILGDLQSCSLKLDHMTSRMDSFEEKFDIIYQNSVNECFDESVQMVMNFRLNICFWI